MEVFVGYLQVPAKKIQQFTQRCIIGVGLSASTEVADNLILGAKQSRAKITTVMRMRTNARSMGRCAPRALGRVNLRAESMSKDVTSGSLPVFLSLLDLPLLDHQLPQSPVDPCLVAPSAPLEPRQHVGIQPQRYRLLQRLVHASEPLWQVLWTPSRPRRLDFGDFSRCTRSPLISFA